MSEETDNFQKNPFNFSFWRSGKIGNWPLTSKNMISSLFTSDMVLISFDQHPIVKLNTDYRKMNFKQIKKLMNFGPISPTLKRIAAGVLTTSTIVFFVPHKVHLKKNLSVL